MEVANLCERVVGTNTFGAFCIWGFLLDARISGLRQKDSSSSEETEALFAGLKAAPGLDGAEWIGRGSRPPWDPSAVVAGLTLDGQ